MYRELIARLDAEATFHPPATLEELRGAESRLGVTLPAELRDALLETNGAEVAYGVGLVWSSEEIARRNLDMRREWRGGEWRAMPVDHLLFFGELGNGDLVCIPVTLEGAGNCIFLWDHEDDSRTSVATSLADWLQGTDQTA
ncbi:MAG TPA: SMI1/KNR4 family protein [Ktedonobacterales bacterium]|jgi:cell wall assembly regulator SMI1|nr:SMI1/KNR4 family protein [Ktedonobacterales bacterium]